MGKKNNKGRDVRLRWAAAAIVGAFGWSAFQAACTPTKVGDDEGANGGGNGGGKGGGAASNGGGKGGNTGAGSGSGSTTGSGGFIISFVDALEQSDAGPLPIGNENLLDTLEACGEYTFKVERTPPELMVVLDRSGSMKHAINGAAPVATALQRWDIATKALATVLSTTEDDISWGMKMYPTCKHRDGSGTYDCDYPSGTVNPCAIDGLVWDPMLSQAQLLTGLFTPNEPYIDAGATPTAPAIDAAVAKLKTITTPNPKYLLLVTDGAPNCGVFTGSADVNITARCTLLGGVGTRCDSVADEPGSIDAVKRARAAGYPVFVVGFSMDAGLVRAHDTLNSMAIEGGRARNDATYKYYLADTGAELQTALDEIAASTISCTFPLKEAPREDAQAAVDVDGKRLPEDATNGWSFAASKKAIVFNGLACEKLKQGEFKETAVTFGCPGKPLPEPPPPAL